MKEVEVTWGKAATVWWSLFWGVLFGGLGGTFVGVIAGITLAALGEDVEKYITMLNIFGVLIGIPIAIWVVKIVEFVKDLLRFSYGFY